MNKSYHIYKDILDSFSNGSRLAENGRKISIRIMKFQTGLKKHTDYRPVRRKLEWGVLIHSIVDPRCGGLGVQPPAAVAYLTKDNPENRY